MNDDELPAMGSPENSGSLEKVEFMCREPSMKESYLPSVLNRSMPVYNTGQGVTIPRLNFNALGKSPHMPRLSELPVIKSCHKAEGSSDDDGIDANDEINFP